MADLRTALRIAGRGPGTAAGFRPWLRHWAQPIAGAPMSTFAGGQREVLSHRARMAQALGRCPQRSAQWSSTGCGPARSWSAPEAEAASESSAAHWWSVAGPVAGPAQRARYQKRRSPPRAALRPRWRKTPVDRTGKRMTSCPHFSPQAASSYLFGQRISCTARSNCDKPSQTQQT